jgi:hypothetical protein
MEIVEIEERVGERGAFPPMIEINRVAIVRLLVIVIVQLQK